MVVARTVERADLVAVAPDQIRSAFRIATSDQLVTPHGELQHEIPRIREIVDENPVIAQASRTEQNLDEPLQPRIADRPKHDLVGQRSQPTERRTVTPGPRALHLTHYPAELGHGRLADPLDDEREGRQFHGVMPYDGDTMVRWSYQR